MRGPFHRSDCDGSSGSRHERSAGELSPEEGLEDAPDEAPLVLGASRLAEAVEELVKELPGVGQMTFRALTADLVDRIEVVVRFLAVLELFKQGVVELDQASAFGDITVIWTGGEGVSADAIVIDTYEG